MNDPSRTDVQVFAAVVVDELARHPTTTDPARRDNQVRQAVEAALQVCDMKLARPFKARTLPATEPSSPGVIRVRGRYFAVLAGMAQGERQHEVAKRLSMPQGTVSSYMYRLKEELGVETTTEAVVMFSKGEVAPLDSW